MCMIVLHEFQVLFFYPLSLKTLKLVLNKLQRPGDIEDFFKIIRSGPIQTHSTYVEHLLTCGTATWLRHGTDPSIPSMKITGWGHSPGSWGITLPEM